jgi:curli biogenesis system outer membrane secretion channel CsgG
MKLVLKYAIRIFSVSALAMGFAMIGCASTAPSAEPSYQSTDIKTQPIPPVRDEFQGARVAPVAFTNKTLSRYRFLGDATVDLLPEFLLEAGFQPLESATKGSDLSKVLDELKYGQSSNVDQTTAASIGKQLGAKYVFIGSVTSYKEVKASGSRGIRVGFLNLGKGTGTITYDMQVSGRLVEVETRAIIASKSVSHKETFKVEGGRVSTPWGGYNQSESIKVEQEVGGKVLNHAMNRMMNQIVQQINGRRIVPRK